MFLIAAPSSSPRGAETKPARPSVRRDADALRSESTASSPRQAPAVAAENMGFVLTSSSSPSRSLYSLPATVPMRSNTQSDRDNSA
jgi:hypothetical protein